MSHLYGRQAFVELLISEGVTHLFGNPGTTELPIMQALPDYPGLKFILGLQESVVMGMADGYARASRQLTAANVHVAPGLGNAMGALYNAKFSGSPVILTAGQQEQGHGLLEPLLYDDLTSMAAPLVKWSIEVTRLQDLPRIMRRAAKIAMTPPTGPVFISLPGDILNEIAEIDMGQSVRIDHRVRPSDKSLDELANALLSAKNPVIISGQELSSQQAFVDASALASLLGAGVFQESVPFSATFPTSHPQYLGMLTRSQENVRKTLDPFDLVLCLGADLLRMSVYSPVEPLPNHSRVLHLSERSWELGKNYRTELALQANVCETLSVLLPLLRSRIDTKYEEQAQIRAIALEQQNWTVTRNKLATQVLTQSSMRPMSASTFVMHITNQLTPDVIVVEEALTSTQSLPQYLHQHYPDSFFGLASGGLGFAIPGAVGVSMAKPGRPVVAIVGDGSAMYGIQGLWSAAHFKLPITYVIANNKGYRIIKERLVSMQGSDRFIGMDMNDPAINYCQLAQSMGMGSIKVSDPADLDAALKAGIQSGKPNLIEVVVSNGFGN
ncbi:MAG: thiamine pyrophosphate-dependent enzyme [Betaproteobacteria bacterium]